MNFWLGLALTNATHLLPLARKAEALGFAGVALGDHLLIPETLSSPYPYTPDGKVSRITWTADFPDVWVAIGAMAATTTRLRFLTDVYILPLRNPLIVAKAVATAAVLSGDRVILGVGSGWLREE